MNTSISADPFKVLGVPQDASEAELRARYLQLVKQFPPERDPDKFRQVQAAFEAAKDPLEIAQRMVDPPDDDHPPQWSDAIEEQRHIPPVLSPTLLLSLGNRAEVSRRTEAVIDSSEVASDPEDNNEPDQKQHFVEQPHE